MPPRRLTATLNVIGKDKSGVIAKIATFLYHQGGNIEDLEQHVTEGLFTMQMEISWPANGLPERGVRKGLDGLAKELDMTILFRAHQADAQKPRLGVLVTKESHCLEALLRQTRSGRIPARLAMVASNRTDLRSWCKRRGLPFFYVDDRDKSAHEAALLAEFDKAEVNYVVLARYMRILSPNFVWRYPNRIVNVHPSLLPSFPGPAAYRQALRAGVRYTGVTSHFVTMNLDEGPIITQRVLPVHPGDTVEAVRRRGHDLEAQVLCDAVRLLVQRKLEVHWGRVAIQR